MAEENLLEETIKQKKSKNKKASLPILISISLILILLIYECYNLKSTKYIFKLTEYGSSLRINDATSSEVAAGWLSDLSTVMDQCDDSCNDNGAIPVSEIKATMNDGAEIESDLYSIFINNDVDDFDEDIENIWYSMSEYYKAMSEITTKYNDSISKESDDEKIMDLYIDFALEFGTKFSEMSSYVSEFSSKNIAFNPSYCAFCENYATYNCYSKSEKIVSCCDECMQKINDGELDPTDVSLYYSHTDTNDNSDSSFEYHKCEVPGCNRMGKHKIQHMFDDSIYEWYCDYHYDEMNDAVEKIFGSGY